MLAGSQIFNRDAVQFLTEFRYWLDCKDTFLYIDPPYPHSSRKSNTRYAWEMSDKDHRDLLVCVLDGYRHARIAISTYPNDLYDLWLDDWRRIEFESTTRGGPAKEWLLMNYPEPDQLHDYQYLGDDYREREQFARISRRWRAKLKRLPHLLQQKLLADLSSTIPTK